MAAGFPPARPMARSRPQVAPNPELAAAYDGPSKSQLKRDATELQDLGRAMLDLPDKMLDEVAMDDDLRAALRELKRLGNHRGAQRRQAQFVGKLLRSADPEPLRQALAAHEAGKVRDAQRLHQAERWRDRLLADDKALTEWVSAYPAGSDQAFRTLLRNARREQANAPPPEPGLEGAPRKGKLYRELFQAIRAAMRARDAGPGAGDDGEHDAG